MSTDKYNGICQNCIRLLAVQAVFRTKLSKSSLSLFRDGYFKHEKLAFELSQQGEIIDQYFDYYRDDIVEWDTWIRGKLPQELQFRAARWYEEFKPKRRYEAIHEFEVYTLRFWVGKSLIDLLVSSPTRWLKQGATELNEFIEIWNILKNQGAENFDLKKIQQ